MHNVTSTRRGPRRSAAVRRRGPASATVTGATAVPKVRATNCGAGCDAGLASAQPLRDLTDPRAAATAAGRRWSAGWVCVGQAGSAAHPGVRQLQLDPGRCFMVPGEFGDDAADLLVAGQRQERRRPAVGLHPHQIEPWLGMGQLGDSVRRDGAAGVHVRVDLWGQPHRRLQDRVQLEPQLRQERQIGPETGQHHHPIGRRQPPPVLGHQHHSTRVTESPSLPAGSIFSTRKPVTRSITPSSTS